MRPRPCHASPGAARRGRDAKHRGDNTDRDPNRRKDRRLSPTGPVRHRHPGPGRQNPAEWFSRVQVLAPGDLVMARRHLPGTKRRQDATGARAARQAASRAR